MNPLFFMNRRLSSARMIPPPVEITAGGSISDTDLRAFDSRDRNPISPSTSNIHGISAPVAFITSLSISKMAPPYAWLNVFQSSSFLHPLDRLKICFYVSFLSKNSHLKLCRYWLLENSSNTQQSKKSLKTRVVE